MCKTLRIVLATVLGAAALTTFAPSASADNSICQGNAICLYQNSDFNRKKSGSSFVRVNPAQMICVGFPAQFRNTASSMINNSWTNVYLFTGQNCTGRLYRANLKSEDSTFNDNPGINDQIESLRAGDL